MAPADEVHLIPTSVRAVQLQLLSRRAVRSGNNVRVNTDRGRTMGEKAMSFVKGDMAPGDANTLGDMRLGVFSLPGVLPAAGGSFCDEPGVDVPAGTHGSWCDS